MVRIQLFFTTCEIVTAWDILVYSCFSYQLLRRLRTMTSRTCRHRPPKGGGTNHPSLGATPFHAQMQRCKLSTTTNHYSILSSNSTSRVPIKSLKPFKLTPSHRKHLNHFKQTIPSSTGPGWHTDLDGFTLVKKFCDKTRFSD